MNAINKEKLAASIILCNAFDTTGRASTRNITENQRLICTKLELENVVSISF